MRHPIWKADDVFKQLEGDKIREIAMDASVVELTDEPLPLTWNFDWNMKSEGHVTDLRLEDGAITGELEFFEESHVKKLLNDINTDQNDAEKLAYLGIRLGGYYDQVEPKAALIGNADRVSRARLKGVSFLLEPPAGANPGAKI